MIDREKLKKDVLEGSAIDEMIKVLPSLERDQVESLFSFCLQEMKRMKEDAVDSSIGQKILVSALALRKVNGEEVPKIAFSEELFSNIAGATLHYDNKTGPKGESYIGLVDFKEVKE